jgi:hypothetical protein
MFPDLGGDMEREIWCKRFVRAWGSFTTGPTEKSSRSEAEAAYKVASPLSPEEAALIVFQLEEQQLSIPSRRPRERRSV